MTRNIRPFVLALLLVASLAAGSVGAATTDRVATGDDQRIVAAADGAGTVSLSASEYQTTAGETVGIGVEFADSETATLLVGDSEQSGYQANVSLTDGDGDGVVTVQFDSSAAGDESSTVVRAAATEDTAELTGQTGLDSPLAVGSYDLAVSTDATPAGTESDPDDTGSLHLRERTEAAWTGNVSLSPSPIRVAGGSGQVVAGTADMPEGTELTLRVRSTNATVGFLKSTPVTVTPEGTFAAEFDFGEQSHGDEFVVRALRDSEELDAAEGRVVADGTPTATVTATSTATSTATASTATATSTATPTPTETSVPGFGVPAALLAVLATLVALKRP